jgi:hypothetical protein
VARLQVIRQDFDQLSRELFTRTDLANEIVKLHPMCARCAPDELKSLLGLEAVSLGHDSLGLLDRDAGLERVLELCAPLIGRLGDREEPADRCGCLVARTVAESLDRLDLGPILQEDDFNRDSRPANSALQ